MLASPFDSEHYVDFHTGEIYTTQHVREQGFTLLSKIEAFCLLAIKYDGLVNAFQLCLYYNRMENAHLDWHEFSSALDHLNSLKLIRVASHNSDGMCNYEVTK